jgi:3-methyladenine DNA glycosylase Tag
MGARDQNVEMGIMGAGSARPPASRRAFLVGAAAGHGDRAQRHARGRPGCPGTAVRPGHPRAPGPGTVCRSGAHQGQGVRAQPLGAVLAPGPFGRGDLPAGTRNRGDAEGKPVAAQLIRDAGFDPVDLGGIDDSRLQDPGSALWAFAVTHDEATALVTRTKSGDPAAADPLTAPLEKFRDHAPDDPAFFFEHLSRSVFEAGIWQVVQNKWAGIREAFHGFDPAQVAAMTPAEIAATENDARVIRNKAKIRATVDNAREVLAIVDSYGSIHAYFASFPDAHAASADMQRRFKFLGNTGVWRLLNGAARDIPG